MKSCLEHLQIMDKVFENKINLSNSASDSQNAEVQSSGDRVFVTWWERNSTSNEPVLRVSGDDGKTFGPTLKSPLVA